MLISPAFILLIPIVLSATPYWWYDKTNLLADRQTLVHLFEWKWTDIAKECEDFLQHYGYGAVQISPPMEHLWVVEKNNVPWWIRYQPVSYSLTSRSGTEGELQDMIKRCNKVGVRVIVDVVMNHMVGVGQKSGVDGRGSSGTNSFDGTDGVESFPGVPYTNSHFNDYRCHHDIQGSDYQNSATNVKDCRLVGLLDLDQGNQYVRTKLSGYLNKLIDMGVAGFRCDASKHMWPEDIEAVLGMTKNLKEDIFGANQRAFIVHEVIDRGGEAVKCADYLNVGRYTNFNFGAAVSSAVRGQQDFQNLWDLGPGYGYGNNEDHDVLNFIDNHDNQRDSNPYVVTYKEGLNYKLAVSFMLAWPYGFPRVMSSYDFSYSDQGPPNEGSGNGYKTKSPTFNPDSTCAASSGWVCEHRWPTIRQMALFRSTVQGTAAAEEVKESGRLAFAREGRGFFALNNRDDTWARTFQTTLPAGTYCDQYSGELKGSSCTSKSVTIDASGKATIYVPGHGAVAISMASRIGGPLPPPAVPTTYTKTAIFIKKQTNIGENLFVRGGTNRNANGQNNQCLSGPYKQGSDPCAVPILHNTTTPFFFAEYRMWSQADNYLDFEGAEEKQGTHDGTVPFGTPLAYTTNDPNAVEYNPLNKYGAGYWLVEMFVDCSKVYKGWFELKGYLSPSVGWENNISQGSCSGSVGGSAPFTSINHVAKCGAVNVFEWNSGACVIDRL